MKNIAQKVVHVTGKILTGGAIVFAALFLILLVTAWL